MITETTIDKVLGRFESEDFDYEQAIREFAGRQPAIVSFLMADQEGALTEDERDFMLYLALVIWRSVEDIGPATYKVTAKEVAETEEANWDLLDRTSGATFRERLNVFFEDTGQEDLLAFVEDSLTSEQEEEDGLQVTAEGREPVFIALKTVIDVLTNEM